MEEYRLRVFENKVLRRIFRPKGDEVTGGWRKLHNEELRHLYSSPSIIRIIKSRRMRWAGHVARMGEKRSAYRLLVGKPILLLLLLLLLLYLRCAVSVIGLVAVDSADK
jgi:hypothetical protein